MTVTPIPAAIQVRDLVVGFGDRTVIDHVSLDVARGEILGVVGGSGSGKSVLLASIIGLLPKRCGRIEIGGVDLDHADAVLRRQVANRWGVLFQQGALFSSLTAVENVAFPMLEQLDVTRGLATEVALAKLAMVGLDARDGAKFPAELSGGMTKRVALARALALEPELLLLDEPTSGLDPISAGDFDTLIATLHKTLGLTVFMITHDLASLDAICDRVAVLVRGRFAAIGTMAALRMSREPSVQAYFKGRWADAPANDRAAAPARAGS